MPNYFVVSCETQTQGKGRWGRKWWSPQGGVWCSLVTPKILIPSLRAAFSVVQTIRKFTPLRAGIRWPNDIIVRNKKVGGVLTEVVMTSSGAMTSNEKLIIGIGVNINQDCFPPELPEATSLRIETGKIFSTQEFLDKLVQDFEMNLTNSKIVDEIREMLLLFGKRITVKVKGGIKTGNFLDIGEDGNLLMREDTGIISELTPSEVEFIR